MNQKDYGIKNDVWGSGIYHFDQGAARRRPTKIQGFFKENKYLTPFPGKGLGINIYTDLGGGILQSFMNRSPIFMRFFSSGRGEKTWVLNESKIISRHTEAGGHLKG
jgi:hypothetical protein